MEVGKIPFKDRTKYNIGSLNKYKINQTENWFPANVYKNRYYRLSKFAWCNQRFILYYPWDVLKYVDRLILSPLHYRKNWLIKLELYRNCREPIFSLINFIIIQSTYIVLGSVHKGDFPDLQSYPIILFIYVVDRDVYYRQNNRNAMF